MNIPKKDIEQFQSHIRKRRAINRRDLPRRKTTDPYKIRISETMLCQTQVSRVINYYNDWMRKFPTITSLANSTNMDVLSSRSGLWYNSRWLRVKQSAEIINNNKFPDSYNELIALPWIWDYVANAILAFAYNQDVAVIDTNIRRILIHQFKLDEKISLKSLKEIALKVLPIGYARERYNALMDYGALELTAKRSGIKPTTRQSKFEWSRRQVRAWIIKQLVDKKTIGFFDIQTRFSDRNDIDSIINDLVKEGIVIFQNWVLSIV